MRSGEREVLELEVTMRSVETDRYIEPRLSQEKAQTILRQEAQRRGCTGRDRLGAVPDLGCAARSASVAGGYQGFSAASKPSALLIRRCVTFIFSFILNYKRSLLHSTLIKYGRRSRRPCLFFILAPYRL